jgi:hypothetical protein
MVAMSDRRPNQRALLLRHEELYGLHQIVAMVVYLTADGLRSPLFSPYDPATELADLEISAHLSRDVVGAYGHSIAFKPHQVELARAVSMARVLRRVDRRMREAQTRFGSPGEDFHRYLTQAADALRISRFLIGQPTGRRSAGERPHRRAHADEVRAWIDAEIRLWTRPPTTEPAEAG